jgi:hypothetical protein
MSSNANANHKKLVIATRLHLGNASTPPSERKLLELLDNLECMARHVEGAVPVIAVDATPKIENYDYVEAIRKLLPKDSRIQILPVTPWGKFVPALNALVLHATSSNLQADWILFVSAEVTASANSIRTLCHHLVDDEDVIVAGAAMNGHLYNNAGGGAGEVELNGRTCPWNTLAVWNLKQLSLTGFPLCSDQGSAAGVEECVAIAMLQKLFPKSKAKLVKLKDIHWEETFEDDERRKWHEHKMASKRERAGQQMERLQLTGTVIHC